MRAMTYDNSRRISNISPQYNNNNSPHNYSLRRHGMSSWFLFIVGCCLGHWHGRFFTASVEHGVLVLLHNNGNSASDRSLATTTSLPPSSLLPSRNNNDCLRPDGNGWRTIQVFYGKDKPLHDNSTIPDMNYDLSSPASTTTTTTERKSASPLVQRERQQQQGSSGQQQRWYSQARQDELVIALLRNQTNGYFVDLAANDAVQFSNTYAMEKFYNWKGVCIEPNPAYWHNLTLHRTCAIIGAVVGAQRMQGKI